VSIVNWRPLMATAYGPRLATTDTGTVDGVRYALNESAELVEVELKPKSVEYIPTTKP
jgi:hypothetical protein